MRASVLLLLVSSIYTIAFAQVIETPVVIDPSAANAHLLTHEPNHIPPIARAAHVFGDVKLQLFIDAGGHVTSAVPLSGPPMLLGAANDDVLQWSYAPFTKDDQPVIATTLVTLSYNDHSPSPKSSSTLPQGFLNASAACFAAIRENQSPEKSSKACMLAANEAEKVPADVPFAGRRLIFLYASSTLLKNNQKPEALMQANNAVAAVQLGHDTLMDTAAAYVQRGQANAALGHLSEADKDLGDAEQRQRVAIETIQSEPVKASYQKILKAVLGFHAIVLNAMKNPSGAQAKTDEAAKL